MKLKKVRNLAVASVVILGVLTVVFFLVSEFISNYFVRNNMDSIDAPGSGARLLVFAPHNDDEVLGAGELIKKTLQNGGQVKVVFMTNGDGYKSAMRLNYFKFSPSPEDYIEFGYTRQKESTAALEHLGMDRKDIIFLGYPDGGISSLWTTFWDCSTLYKSRYTKAERSPYANSYTKSAAYNGQSVVSDITDIIKEYEPTHIVYPHPNDRHLDHWATNAFVKYTLTQMNYKAEKEWLYLVHRGDWPTPMKKNTALFLVPPAKLVNTGTIWHALDLSQEDVQDKAYAISLYKTQKILKPLLMAFERRNELLGEYEDSHIVENTRNDSDIKAMPENRIFVDPLQDALGLKISRSADISGLYAEISKEGNLHVMLETDAKEKDFVEYALNFVFMNENDTNRLNLTIKGNDLAIQGKDGNMQADAGSIRLKHEGRIIHLIIPGSITGENRHIYVNAASYLRKSLIDKTVWKMIDL